MGGAGWRVLPALPPRVGLPLAGVVPYTQQVEGSPAAGTNRHLQRHQLCLNLTRLPGHRSRHHGDASAVEIYVC